MYKDGFVIKRSILRLRTSPLHIMTVGKLFTHTHVLLSPSSIILNQPKGGYMFCDWDGNGRPGTAMAHSSDFFSCSAFGQVQCTYNANLLCTLPFLAFALHLPFLSVKWSSNNDLPLVFLHSIIPSSTFLGRESSPKMCPIYV